MHSEGRYRSATAKHEYHFKDHLGNTRLVYCDTDNNGWITVNNEILQESHYYPFGLEFRGHYLQQSGYDYRYKFNDIERLKDLDVGIDMAFYRGLDPTTGRWMQVDPKAEAAGFGMSPYCAMGNNPVLHTDPNGDLIPVLAAMAIGGIINMAINHKQINSFQDGLVAFGIGAGAVGIGIATGGAAAGAVVGTGATTTALSSSAILTATMTAGAAGAGTEALLRTTGNALYFGKKSVGDALGDGIASGVRGIGEGLVFGAITGVMAIKAGTYSNVSFIEEANGPNNEWYYPETGTNKFTSIYKVPGANNAGTAGSFSSLMNASEAARYAKYWSNVSPKQVTPGVNRLDWIRESGRTGRTEVSRVIYDKYGRQSYRVDFSDHMRSIDHSNPHLHQYEYGQMSSFGKESVFNFFGK